MKFPCIDIELSGINDVRVDGALYTRCTASTTTTGGKIVTNKYFKREKDGYLIREQKFINKLRRLMDETQSVPFKYARVDAFNDVHYSHSSYGAPKWRMWIDCRGGTINVEKVLI